VEIRGENIAIDLLGMQAGKAEWNPVLIKVIANGNLSAKSVASAFNREPG
jgi:hypothetical protein